MNNNDRDRDLRNRAAFARTGTPSFNDQGAEGLTVRQHVVLELTSAWVTGLAMGGALSSEAEPLDIPAAMEKIEDIASHVLHHFER